MMVFIDTLFRFLRIVKLFTVIITRGPYRAIQVNAGGAVFRLHLGPYRSQDDARSIADRIQSELGLRPLLVVR